MKPILAYTTYSSYAKYIAMATGNETYYGIIISNNGPILFARDISLVEIQNRICEIESIIESRIDEYGFYGDQDEIEEILQAWMISKIL